MGPLSGVAFAYTYYRSVRPEGGQRRRVSGNSLDSRAVLEGIFGFLLP